MRGREDSAPALPTWLGYTVSFLGLVVAIVLRHLLDPWLGPHLPLSTLYGAVALAVWLSGWQAAAAATVVGYLAADLLLIEPRGQVGPFDPRHVVGAAAYLFSCAVIIVFGEAMRRARDHARIIDAARALAQRDHLAALAQLHTVTESMSAPVTRCSRDLRYLWVSKHYASWIGRRADQIVGQKIVDVLGREAFDRLLPRFQDVLAGNVVQYEEQVHFEPLGPRWISAVYNPTFDARGEVDGWVAVVTDVTERRQAEASRAHMAAVVESSDDAIVTKDLNGVITSWNNGARRVYGYAANEAVGKPVTMLIPADRRGEEEMILSRVRRGERVEPYETFRRRKSGEVFPVSLTVWPVRDQSGTIIGASKIARDLSKVKRVEQELRASEERFRQVAKVAPAIIWTAAPDGTITYVSDRWFDYTGIAREQNPTEWPDVLHPDDRQRCLQAWSTALQTGDEYEIEVRNRARDGSYRWFVIRAVPSRDHTGRICEWHGSTTDIHDRKIAEQELQHADRRKDEFLATLAHELRNPLAAITSSLELMSRTSDDAHAAARDREVVRRQVAQLVRLVDDLLDVGRITRNKLELRREPIELQEVIRTALETCTPLLRECGHQLTLDLPPQPVHLDADPARLSQVFANVLNNACKYTDAGGRIHLSAMVEQNELIVTVTDNGAGIPSEMLPRVFDIFAQVDRSLERSRGGLGIGLHLVKRIVELHGGSVEARSEGIDRGSSFIIRLPIVTAPSPRPPARNCDAQTKPRRVLIVDDNVDSARALARLLGMSGHHIDVAHDGEAAVQKALAGEPDVVLLDIGLPKMNGYDACRAIRQRLAGHRPMMVALTGWGQEQDRREAQEAGFDDHLTKPVSFSALSTLLQDGLDRLDQNGK